MTNREYIIQQLSDPNCIDDGGASYEAMVNYHVCCPYTALDERAHCFRKDINRQRCYRCKEEWLDQEVDQ